MWSVLVGVALAADPMNGWLPGATPDEAGDVELSVDGVLGGGAIVDASTVVPAVGLRLRVSPHRRLRLSVFGSAGARFSGGYLPEGPIAPGSVGLVGGTVVGQLVDEEVVRVSAWLEGAVVFADLAAQGAFGLPGLSLEVGRRKARLVVGLGVPVWAYALTDHEGRRTWTVEVSPLTVLLASEIGLKLAYNDGFIFAIGKIGPGLGLKLRKNGKRVYAEGLLSASLVVNEARVSVGWRFGKGGTP